MGLGKDGREVSHPPPRVKILKVGLKCAQGCCGTEVYGRILFGPHLRCVWGCKWPGADFCAFGPLFYVVNDLQTFRKAGNEGLGK